MINTNVSFIGNLGGDPDLKYMADGKAVCNVNVAENRVYTDGSGQKITTTTWFRVAFWGKMAENVATYLHKGSQVAIEGVLNPDKNGGPKIWDDKEGNPHASYDVTCREIKFLGGKGSGSSSDDDDENTQTQKPTKQYRPREDPSLSGPIFENDSVEIDW